MVRQIEVYDGPIGSYECVLVVPDTSEGRREVRAYLGVRSLRWHPACDGSGLVAVAVQPGQSPDDARPMACLMAIAR